MAEPVFRKRMNSYYPEVIQAIDEFKGIIDGEYPEFELVNAQRDTILENAYLHTMGEDRIAQWEKILNIAQYADSTVDMRRNNVIARIRGQGKLNTEMISNIVNAFTGGTAVSWLENSVLHVEITPPPENRAYRFESVEKEIANKTPAHLGLSVVRNYYLWSELKADHATWQDVKDTFDTWEDVLLYVAPNE